MLIAGFPAGSFQANCYVLAPEPGAQALIVDPGEDALDRLDEIIVDHDLHPVGVLLTHGHLDHVASLGDVCARYEIPAWLHPDDEDMLDDPFGALSEQIRQALAGRPVPQLRPEHVESVRDGQTLELGGMSLVVDHTPGHTRGSVVYRLGADGDRPDVLFTGDTLFAGSVGRTDLTGGSRWALNHSLQRKLLSRDDEAVVLPGHGPTSTIGAERQSNPFLAGLQEENRA